MRKALILVCLLAALACGPVAYAQTDPPTELNVKVNRAGSVYNPALTTKVFAEDWQAMRGRNVSYEYSIKPRDVWVLGGLAISEDVDHLARGIYSNGTAGTIPSGYSGLGSFFGYYAGKQALFGGTWTAASGGGSGLIDANIGTRSIAWGEDVTASGTNSVAIGKESEATEQEAFAIGLDAHATGANSFAIGNFVTTATFDSAMVFGLGLNASNLLAAPDGPMIAFGVNSTVPTLSLWNSIGTAGSVGEVGLGLGATQPDSLLQIGAGSTTRAPLKLTLGTNLTSPEAGAIEYDGTHLYWTDSSPTRHQLDGQFLAPVTFTGTSDVVQMTTIGFSTQTNDIAQWQDSSLTNLVTIDNLGELFAQSLELGTVAPTHAEGNQYWDGTDHTLALQTNVTGVTLQVGQEQFLFSKNNSGGLLSNGQVVYVSGAAGSRPRVDLAQADAHATAHVVGVVTADIANGQDGYVTTYGYVRDIDTSSWVAGNVLYLDASTPGDMTSTMPLAPNHASEVATVLFSHASTGVIFVSLQNGTEISANSDVNGTTPLDNYTLQWDAGAGYWDAVADLDVPGDLTVVGDYQTTTAGGPYIEAAVATGANPTLVPNDTDLDTGIGWNAADNLSLINGGSRKLVLSGATAAQWFPVTGGSTVYYLNAATLEWSPNGSTGSVDVGLERHAAGVLEVTDASTGEGVLLATIPGGNLKEDNYGGSPTALALATAGTFYGWVSATAGNLHGGITADVTATVPASDDDHLIIGTNDAGDYDVNFSISFGGSVSSEFSCFMFDTGVRTSIGFTRALGTGGDIGTVSPQGNYTFAAADEVSVRCTATANTKTMNIEQMSLSIRRAGS